MQGGGQAEPGFFQNRQAQPVGDGRALTLPIHETGGMKRREMTRERRAGEVEMRGDVACGHRAFAQQHEDGASGRVGEGFEYVRHISLFSKITKYCKKNRCIAVKRGPKNVM